MNKAVSEALQKVGNQGRYQTYLGLLLFFVACEVNMLIFGPTFIYMNPSFNCSFVDQLVDESTACPRINELENDFTITAALQLYCEKQTIRNIIQSISAVGAIIGPLIFNYISDTRGRKIGLIIPQFLVIFSVCLIVCGGWFQSIPILIVAQFLSGMASYGLITSTFIIPGQFCENELRQKMTVEVNYAWAFTTILIGILYFFYNVWYNYLIVFVLIPSVLLLLATLYFMVESPFFLHQEGRWQEYAESLRVIASYNQKQFSAQQTVKVSKDYVPEPQEELSFFQVICDPYFLKLIIIMSLTNIGIEAYYSGKSFTLDLAGWEYGYNCIIIGLTQFVAYFVLSQIVNSMPRKKGIIISTCVLIAFSLVFLIRPIVQNLTIQMIFFGINCTIGTFVFTAALLYGSQILPSKISASGFGIIDAVGQLGVLMAPFIVTYCNNHQIFPLVLLAGVQFIFLLIPLLLLNDTRYHKHGQEQGFEIQEEKSDK